MFVPGPSKGCPMDYPSLFRGFHWAHLGGSWYVCIVYYYMSHTKSVIQCNSCLFGTLWFGIWTAPLRMFGYDRPPAIWPKARRRKPSSTLSGCNKAPSPRCSPFTKIHPNLGVAGSVLHGRKQVHGSGGKVLFQTKGD